MATKNIATEPFATSMALTDSFYFNEGGTVAGTLKQITFADVLSSALFPINVAGNYKDIQFKGLSGDLDARDNFNYDPSNELLTVGSANGTEIHISPADQWVSIEDSANQSYIYYSMRSQGGGQMLLGANINGFDIVPNASYSSARLNVLSDYLSAGPAIVFQLNQTDGNWDQLDYITVQRTGITFGAPVVITTIPTGQPHLTINSQDDSEAFFIFNNSSAATVAALSGDGSNLYMYDSVNTTLYRVMGVGDGEFYLGGDVFGGSHINTAYLSFNKLYTGIESSNSADDPTWEHTGGLLINPINAAAAFVVGSGQTIYTGSGFSQTSATNVTPTAAGDWNFIGGAGGAAYIPPSAFVKNGGRGTDVNWTTGLGGVGQGDSGAGGRGGDYTINLSAGASGGGSYGRSGIFTVNMAAAIDTTVAGYALFNQGTLTARVMRITSAATGDDPTVDIHQGKITTTTATTTTLFTYATSSNTAYRMSAQVTARRTGGSAGTAGDSAGYILTWVVKNVAGTLTAVGGATPTALDTREDQAAWDATMDINSSSVRVRVTGATNNNISWTLDKFEVSPLST